MQRRSGGSAFWSLLRGSGDQGPAILDGLMNSLVTSSLPVRTLVLAALLGFSACKTSDSGTSSSTPSADAPTTAKIAQDLSATAAVTAVDKSSRVVTLKNEDGRLFSVLCGEAVRNFDQIAVGDTLRVTYKVSVTASKLPAGEVAAGPSAAVAAGRAPKGQAPAAGIKVAATLRVKIESIDAARDIVVFSSASGEVIAHKVTSDEGRKFVKSLKVGDVVQLDYAESLALGIEKVPSGG